MPLQSCVQQHKGAYLQVPMASCNVDGSAAQRAMQGSEAPLHVQGIPRQQQLVQDLVVPMPGCQVAWGHALVVIAGHIAPSNDQLGYHLQMPPLSCEMQGCSTNNTMQFSAA